MILLAIPALAAAAYYLIALVAGIVLHPRAPLPLAHCPPISILKPLHGSDPHLYEALCSHAEQDYPQFEILAGVSDAADAAAKEIERLRTQYPHVPISLQVIATSAPNVKAGVLAGLAKRARYPILLVNDADIKAPRNYLREVVSALMEPNAGLATCLYRASADSWPSRLEALGIATEFAPSVLVARLLGVSEFALGSTLALRAETLAEIGGFESVAEYLADDYQLGRRVSERGYRIQFAAPVVETALGAQTWSAVWRHQVRWSRTIRVSRPSGYYGYVITHATFWAIVACVAGYWQVGAITLALRIVAGVATARGILRERNALRLFPLIPLRDLVGFTVWIAGLFGSTVVWRGKTLRLSRDGIIRPIRDGTTLPASSDSARK